MALLLEKGLIYLHIPKTGGNWLSHLLRCSGVVLGEYGHKHATYEALLATELAGLGHGNGSVAPRFFCVVRNPLRWYESWYKYQCNREWRDWGVRGNLKKWHVMSDMNDNKDRDFNAFMRNVNLNTPGFVHQLYARYAMGSGAHCLKIESIAEDFLTFCRETGLSVKERSVRSAPPLGVSPPQSIEWDPEVLAETIRNEAPAFRRYGYQPE